MTRSCFGVLLFLFFVSTELRSQTNKIQLSFLAQYGSAKIDLADTVFNCGDSSQLQIQTLKYYISHLRFLKNGAVVLEEKESFHLIDATDSKTQSINVVNTNSVEFDEIRFDLGIDSTTNVSGAMGGDLDPTKGMYWTWQSGYINFKLEGKDNRCVSKNKEFQFHLGGYSFPFNSLTTVSLKTQSKDNILVCMNVDRILKNIDLKKQTHIMSPGKEAVALSYSVSDAFSILRK